MTYGEMFLLFWASAITILYLVSKQRMNDFKYITVMRLKEIANGDAVIVDKGDRIEIVSKEKA